MVRLHDALRLSELEFRRFCMMAGAVDRPTTVSDFNNALENAARRWQFWGPFGFCLASYIRGHMLD